MQKKENKTPIDIVKDMVSDGQISQEVAERYFPELRESEDERIRKSIIGFLITISSLKDGKTVSNEDFDSKAILEWVAWLEKQCEQKSDTNFSDLRTWKYIVDAVWTEKEGIGQYLDSPFTEEVAKKLQKRFGNIGQILANSAKTCKDEQKPTEWSEEDEAALGDALWCCKQAASIAKDENDMGNVWYAEHWLNSIKERVQPQPKQEWSEEDERIRIETIELLETANHPNVLHRNGKPLDFTENINWLKSLRPQNWKPSEEQIKALKEAVDEHFDIDGGALWHLYEDLKKLKEY
jgi:hypothetical protein